MREETNHYGKNIPNEYAATLSLEGILSLPVSLGWLSWNDSLPKNKGWEKNKYNPDKAWEENKYKPRDQGVLFPSDKFCS